jgi:hypothetical protein
MKLILFILLTINNNFLNKHTNHGINLPWLLKIKIKLKMELKYMKTFESFQQEDVVNEGLKSILVAGLLAASALFNTANSQEMANKNLEIRNGEVSTIITQKDKQIINDFLSYHEVIMQQKADLKFSKDDQGFITAIGDNFNTTSRESKSKYIECSSFALFGNPKSPTAQINISLDDQGTISIMFGAGGSASTYQAGKTSYKMNQMEVKKGDRGYQVAYELLMIFMQK